MDTATSISIIGLVLFNISLIFAAWIKVKTDIKALNILHEGFDLRLAGLERTHTSSMEKIDLKVEKFWSVNDKQHEDISYKIDELGKVITDWKIETLKESIIKPANKK